MFNEVMKDITNNVRATVQNDLLVDKLRHRVSFTTGQLLRLLQSSTSATDLPCPVMACGRLVPCITYQMR